MINLLLTSCTTAWTAVSAIAAMLAAGAALTSIVLTIRHHSPRFGIEVVKEERPNIPDNMFRVKNNNCYAFIGITLINTSEQPITFMRASLEFNKLKNLALQHGEYLDPSLLPQGISENDVPIELNILRFPLTLKPYEVVDGVAIFPNFIGSKEYKIHVDLTIKATFQLKSNPIKKIPLINADYKK